MDMAAIAPVMSVGTAATTEAAFNMTFAVENDFSVLPVCSCFPSVVTTIQHIQGVEDAENIFDGGGRGSVTSFFFSNNLPD